MKPATCPGHGQACKAHGVDIRRQVWRDCLRHTPAANRLERTVKSPGKEKQRSDDRWTKTNDERQQQSMAPKQNASHDGRAPIDQQLRRMELVIAPPV